MRFVTIGISTLGIIFTALPFIRSSAWWIRIFDFPRMQVAFICLVALFLLFQFGEFDILHIALIVLVAAALLYQLTQIVQYTPLYPVEALASTKKDPENTVSIFQSNLRMENRNSKRFRDQIFRHNPDIVSINEPDDWWAEHLKDFHDIYPYSMSKPLPNTYGMMLFSRFPLKNEEINFLVDKEIPSFFCTVVLPSGEEFDLHCIHPKPPHPDSPTYERDTELLLVGKRINHSDRPAIVVGDLNDVAWSHTSRRFKQYCAVVDPRQGRGIYNTYNVFVPLFRYPLDHFFYTPHFRLVSLKKMKAIGSDHFPMMIKLNLEGIETKVKAGATN